MLTSNDIVALKAVKVLYQQGLLTVTQVRESIHVIVSHARERVVAA